jgi:hypothetical protein
MDKFARGAIVLSSVLGLAILLPRSSFATVSVQPPSACTSSGDFSLTVGYDSSTQKPTASPGSNTTCVMGGNKVSMTVTLPAAGWTWSATFPSQTAGGSVFANSCTFGSSANTECTVVSGPSSGNYDYSITLTDPNGNAHVLDPRVIIKGMGKPTPRRHQRRAKQPAAAPPPQQ